MLSFFPLAVLNQMWDLLSQFLRDFLPTLDLGRAYLNIKIGLLTDRLAGGHLYGKFLFTKLSLVMCLI